MRSKSVGKVSVTGKRSKEQSRRLRPFTLQTDLILCVRVMELEWEDRTRLQASVMRDSGKPSPTTVTYIYDVGVIDRNW